MRACAFFEPGWQGSGIGPRRVFYNSIGNMESKRDSEGDGGRPRENNVISEREMTAGKERQMT